MAASHSVFAREILSQDNELLVAFDRGLGALMRLEDKATRCVAERRPQLGISFQMFAPLPHRRYNPILGQNQHVDSVQQLSEHEVRLQWKNES